MLDFFLISDDKPKPHNVRQLTFAGCLGEDAFDFLSDKSIIDARYDFYHDFRWDSATVTTLSDQFDNCGISDKVIADFARMLQLAKTSGSGLIAIAD